MHRYKRLKRNNKGNIMKNFSLWCDFIENSFLDNEFLNLLSHGINGATSNPAIFKNAILNSPIYKDKILKLKEKKNKRYL
ncbi:hypothetical protein THJ001_02710 [Campylobacter jejuni]|nr:hypothetical protein THJ001_02710 [Campylobacter jejuni]